MEDHAALVDREPCDLSVDERDSLEFYYAAVNIAEGLPAESSPRRWCLMAQNVARVAHMLGRLPQAGDPGGTEEILMWIEEQRNVPLNGYQRTCLGSVPGGSALLD